MRSDPYRAIRPMISAPATGTSRIQDPSVLSAGEASAVLTRWKKKRLVKKLIRRSRPRATYALTIPIPTAIRPMAAMRGVAVKSPRRRDVPGTLCMLPASPPLVGPLLEEHGGLPIRRIHGPRNGVERGREPTPPCRRQFTNTLDEALLRDVRSAGRQPPAAGRQVELNRAPVPR